MPYCEQWTMRIEPYVHDSRHIYFSFTNFIVVLYALWQWNGQSWNEDNDYHWHS